MFLKKIKDFVWQPTFSFFKNIGTFLFYYRVLGHREMMKSTIYYLRPRVLKVFDIQMGVYPVPQTKNYVIRFQDQNNDFNVLLTRKERRPRNKIRNVLSGQEDITEEIMKWYGPYYDWFGVEMTPFKLGYNKLYFILKDSNILEFNENDIIQI